MMVARNCISKGSLCALTRSGAFLAKGESASRERRQSRRLAVRVHKIDLTKASDQGKHLESISTYQLAL
jgi:hypothetical protein